MKYPVACLALASVLAFLPMAAGATMTDAEATAAVQNMLVARKSSEEVLATLINDGRSLQQATVLAVQAVSGHAKVNLARVGICMARDKEEAEAIARECLEVCTPVTDTVIEGLLHSYVTGGCEQPQYQFHGSPSGSVSPLSPPSGGGSVSPSL